MKGIKTFPKKGKNRKENMVTSVIKKKPEEERKVPILS